MRRRLLIIAICLLLGAVVNVGVAWGCAVKSIWGIGGTSVGASESQWWDQRAPAAFGGQFDGGHHTPSLGALYTWLFGPQQRGVQPYTALRVRAGIPALGLEGSFWYDQNRALVYTDPPLAPQPWLNEGRPFPFRPIWPGFAVNTLFYAALLWLLIPGPFALRRFLRLRRGLCPKCAYPIGESAVCSECGITLPYRMRMPQADMKRRLLIIAVCLALGAVVNVAVAWGCAAFAEIDKQASFFVAERPGSSSVPFFVMVHRRSGFGLDQVAYPPTLALDWQRAGLEVQHTRPDLPRWALWPRAPVDKTILYIAAGWPLKALIGRRAGGWIIPLVEHQGQSSRADPPAFISWWSVSRVLPLRPLPLGFAINTVCYAALLWPLICGPSALRRFLRLRRGLCPKCAHPMGEAAVCTECGMALRSPVRVT